MSNSEWDPVVWVGGIVVFALPLTLLVPDFSVWDVVPKFRVSRFILISQKLTWPKLNSVLIAVLSLLFCLFLEIRKRRLDDMVGEVLEVKERTDEAMTTESGQQVAAVRACARLLDSSSEYYENLVLLQHEMRQLKQHKKDRPPTIEPSFSDN